MLVIPGVTRRLLLMDIPCAMHMYIELDRLIAGEVRMDERACLTVALSI